MTSDKETKLSSFNTERKVSLGIFFSFMSGILYSLTGAIFKYMRNIPAIQLIAYAALGSTCLMVPQLIWNRQNMLGPPGSRVMVLIMSLFGATGVIFFFIAVRYLPLGESTAINCSAPVFVTVLARIFLKEAFGILQVLALVSTIVGVFLTTGLSEEFMYSSKIYSTEYFYGLAAALTSLILFSIYFILVRHLKHVHHSVISFNYMFTLCLLSFVIALIIGNFKLPHKGAQQLYLIFLVVLSFFIQMFINIALQFTEVGPVTIMKSSTQIFFAFLLQVLMFYDDVSGINIIGAVLICLSIFFIGFSKRIDIFFKKICKSGCNLSNN